MFDTMATTIPPGAMKGFLCGYVLMIAVFYGAKLTATRHRDGSAPVFGSRAAGDRQVFRLFQIAIVAVCVARPFAPWVDAAALPIDALAIPALNVAGAALLVAGTALAFYAHTYMGALWRSGVPDDEALERAPDALLQTGPFEISRNPIFLGAQVAQIGFFLAWPSVFTAVCGAIGILMVRRQVAREEASLSLRFGSSYLAYCSRTPRWLF